MTETDVTYIQSTPGDLYLATVLDLRSRRLLGCAFRDHQVRRPRNVVGSASHAAPVVRTAISPMQPATGRLAFTGPCATFQVSAMRGGGRAVEEKSATMGVTHGHPRFDEAEQHVEQVQALGVLMATVGRVAVDLAEQSLAQGVGRRPGCDPSVLGTVSRLADSLTDSITRHSLSAPRCRAFGVLGSLRREIFACPERLSSNALNSDPVDTPIAAEGRASSTIA